MYPKRVTELHPVLGVDAKPYAALPDVMTTSVPMKTAPTGTGMLSPRALSLLSLLSLSLRFETPATVEMAVTGVRRAALLLGANYGSTRHTLSTPPSEPR